jgi:anti-sigma factor RsiW
MTCNEAEILLHALLDGELDAGNAHQVETHVENCPRCAPQLRAYRELQQAMSAAQLRFTAPASLRPCAFGRERLSNAAADAVACTGHDRDLAL